MSATLTFTTADMLPAEAWMDAWDWNEDEDGYRTKYEYICLVWNVEPRINITITGTYLTFADAMADADAMAANLPKGTPYRFDCVANDEKSFCFTGWQPATGEANSPRWTSLT